MKQAPEPSPQHAPGPYSGAAIVAGNVFAIVLAVVQSWNLGPMMLIYWAQSVIIGGFNFLRMLLLRRFSTEGLSSNGRPVPATTWGKVSTALFFAVHYGLFHLAYFAFIASALTGDSEQAGATTGWELDGDDWTSIGWAILGFGLSHGFSFVQNVRADLQGLPNLGTMMFLPYARVIPMHLTILFGWSLGSNRFAVFLFMTLKTGADALMHSVEHKHLQKAANDALEDAEQDTATA